MQFRDFNGTGDWSVQAMLHRYTRYAEQLGVECPLELAPSTHNEADVTWIYPVMENVIAGIEIGDQACTLLGIEFIEQDQGFPFGRILKSNTARALRRAQLSGDQRERIRKRIFGMLLSGNVPFEYKEYSKLLRVGSWWPIVEESVDRKNRSVLRYFRYLQNHAV